MAKKKIKSDAISGAHGALLVAAVVVLILIISIGLGPKGDNTAPIIVGLGQDGPADNQTAQLPDELPEELSDEDLFDAMIGKAYNVESFWYNLSDSERDENNLRMQRGRFGKIVLEEPGEIDGNVFDWVYYDRVYKVAFARCSRDLCGEEGDYEFDYVDYDEYYRLDPVEWMHKFKDPVYAGEDMMGKHIVKVFNLTSLYDEPARMWTQEYYGLPLKIEIEQADGLRTIEFVDLNINTARLGHIMPPINFTVDDKPYQFGWYGYIGKEYDEELKYD